MFGALATLLGALGARLLRKLPKAAKWLSTVPTVLANVLIVPPVLIYAYQVPDAWWFIALTVFIGEAVCAGVGGTALYYTLKKSSATKQFLSKTDI